MQNVLLVIAIMDLWELVDFGNLMFGYMYLEFKKTKRLEVITTATSMIKMEEECGLKKYTECSDLNKSR